ncbi:MAG: hypothetical protein KKA90_00330 [Nanoarchaeota archaeon]|nr:hypothetical protein [Nanoarchaeota archaeon]
MHFLIQYGKNPVLSLAEIVTYLATRSIRFTLLKHTDRYCLLDAAALPSTTIDDLGGSLMIVHLFDPIEELTFETFDNLNFFHEAIKGTKTDKISFAFVGFGDTDLALSVLQDYVKERAKQERIRYLWINKSKGESFHGSFSRAASRKESVQIVAYEERGAVRIGYATGVHDPFAFRHRDLGRPEQRSIYSIPPRLARILLNLARIQPTSTIVDPFCGIGGILQEAALLGARAYGFDVNGKIIPKAQANIDWLAKEVGIDRNQVKLAQSEVNDLSKKCKLGTIDAVVTEPYMGPPLRGRPNREQSNAILDELKPLYAALIREAGKILRQGGRAVIVGPSFMLKKKLVGLPFDHFAKQAGMKVVNPLAGQPVDASVPFADFTDRHRTIRQIWVLEKQ